MRRSTEEHRAQPFRVHAFASDFDLLDVWRYPIRLDEQVSLSEFLDFLTEMHAQIRNGQSLTARLFRLRRWIGRVFGWDRPTKRDPGVQNWLDKADNPWGIIQLRWKLPSMAGKSF